MHSAARRRCAILIQPNTRWAPTHRAPLPKYQMLHNRLLVLPAMPLSLRKALDTQARMRFDRLTWRGLLTAKNLLQNGAMFLKFKKVLRRSLKKFVKVGNSLKKFKRILTKTNAEDRQDAEWASSPVIQSASCANARQMNHDNLLEPYLFA